MLGGGNLFGTNISNILSSNKDELEDNSLVEEIKNHGRTEYNKLLSSGIINEENKNKQIHDFTLKQQYDMAKYSSQVLNLYHYKNKDLVKVHKDAELVRTIIQLFLTYPFLLKLFSVSIRHTALKEYNELSGAIFINEENQGKQMSDFSLEEQTRMSKYAEIVSGLDVYLTGKQMADQGSTDASVDNNIVYATDLLDNIKNLYQTYPFIKKIGERSPDETKSYSASRGGKYSKRRRSKRKRSYKKKSKDSKTKRRGKKRRKGTRSK